MPRPKKTPAVAEKKTILVPPEPTGTIADAVAPYVEIAAEDVEPAPRGRGRKKKQKAPEVTEEEDFVGYLIQRFPGKVMEGNQYTMPWTLRRLPTGLTSLDIALGGGLPAGVFSMFIGQPSCGKNMLAGCVIARQQEIWGDDLRVAICTTEGAWDKTQARFQGIQVAYSEDEIAAMARARARAGNPLNAAEIADLRKQIGRFVVTKQGMPSDEMLEMALEFVRSRKFHVVLIDSFGAMVSGDDLQKELTENDRVSGAAGMQSRFATRVMQALSSDAKGNPNMTCVIGINQVRDNIDKANPNSPKTKEPGAWALKHARGLCIELARQGWQNLEKGSRERTGKDVGWAIIKQKAGGHEGATGDFLYSMTSGPDFAQDVIATAVEWGVIRREKGNSYYDGDNLIGPEKGCGLTRAARWLEEEPEYVQDLYDRCLAAADIYCNYR